MSLHRVCAGGRTKPYYPPGSFQLAVIQAVDFGWASEEAQTVSFMVCGECYRAGHGYHIPRYERLEQGGQHVCPRCGFVVGIHLDMGSLDLGLVREQADPLDDFRVFGETFEQTARRSPLDRSRGL